MGVKEGDDDGIKGNGNGDGDKEGDSDQPRQHKKRVASERRQGNGTKDMAAHTTPGERGMIRVGRDTYARFMVGVID